MKRNYILFILALSTGNILVGMQESTPLMYKTIDGKDAWIGSIIEKDSTLSLKLFNEKDLEIDPLHDTIKPLLLSNDCTPTLISYALKEDNWRSQLFGNPKISKPVSGKLFSKALLALRTIAEGSKYAPEVIDRARETARLIIANCDKFYTDEIETNPKAIIGYDESLNVAFVAQVIPLEYWDNKELFTPEAQSKLFKLLNSDACNQFTVTNVMGSDAGALSLIIALSVYNSDLVTQSVMGWPEARGRLINLRKDPSQFIKKQEPVERTPAVTPVPYLAQFNRTITRARSNYNKYDPKKLIGANPLNFLEIAHEKPTDRQHVIALTTGLEKTKAASCWIKPAIVTALFGGAAALGWYTYPQWKSYVQPFNPLPSLAHTQHRLWPS